MIKVSLIFQFSQKLFLSWVHHTRSSLTVRYEFGMGAIEVVCDHVTTAPRWPVRDIGPGVVGCSENI